MKILTVRSGIRMLAFTLVTALALAASSQGQSDAGGAAPSLKQQPAQGANQPAGQSGQQPAAPPINPKEQADYKVIYNTNPDSSDTVIQLCKAFLVNYPTSVYKESVYNDLLHGYYSKQDWDNFYSTADKVIAIDPDDVAALAVVGWVIPHVFHSSDPDAQLKLAKAETYDKHVLDLVPTMVKPVGMTDERFATMKAQALVQAHSGLGLVYFREQKAPEAVTELQQAVAGDPQPDPTDLFVLGIELMQTDRAAEASDAFQKCSAAPGPLQDQCKQRGDQAKKQAASAPK